MKNLIAIFSIVLLFTACSKNNQYANVQEMLEAAKEEVELVEVSFLHDLMHGDGETVYTLIDVRESTEHYAGFIPGSVNLSRGSMEFNIDKDEFWDEVGLYKPAKDETIILYCKKGERSVFAAESLKKLGYEKVYVIIGGWKTWERTYPDEYEKNLEKMGGHEATTAKSGGC